MTTDVLRCRGCGCLLGRSWSSSHARTCEGWTDPRLDLADSGHSARPVVEEVAS